MRLLLCAFLPVVGFSAMLASGQQTPPATRPATGPTVIAPASQPASDAENAANELSDYINAHRDTLEAAMRQANFNPNGGPEEYAKLKALLPANLATKVDLAVPVLNRRRLNTRIAENLKTIGTAIELYAAQKDNTLPPGLGQLITMVPSIEVFEMPDAKIPDEAAHGTADQQTPWINMHTIYAFPAAGMKRNTLTDHTVVAYERLDVDAAKPTLAVLYGDGHVETADRAVLERLLKQR